MLGRQLGSQQHELPEQPLFLFGQTLLCRNQQNSFDLGRQFGGLRRARVGGGRHAEPPQSDRIIHFKHHLQIELARFGKRLGQVEHGHVRLSLPAIDPPA